MVNVCLIVQNSYTMGQKYQGSLSLLDFAKNTIQAAIKVVFKNGINQNNEKVHLFSTSHPHSYLSSFQHDQSHFYYQLRSLQTHQLTNPASTIQYAIDHISKFRVLSQAQTLKGYRQGFIYQPYLIIMFGDKLSLKKIQKIKQYLHQNKLNMRSQYQFVYFLICPHSLSEHNLITEEQFRLSIQNSKQVLKIIDLMKLMNSQIFYLKNFERIPSIVINKITQFQKYLIFKLQIKQIKKKINQFVPSQRGTDYFNAWKNNKQNIILQTIPVLLWSLPIPCPIQFIQENTGITIKKVNELKFYLDLSKKCVIQNMASCMPANVYKILPSIALSYIQNELLTQKFPIFIQYKGTQMPIGLLCFTANSQTQIKLYFGNFSYLNPILKVIQTNQNNLRNIVMYNNINQSILQYLNTVPLYYIKQLKKLCFRLNIEFNTDILQNNINYIQTNNSHQRLENIRKKQEKQINSKFISNLELHQKNKSQCCPIYSQNLQYMSKYVISKYPPKMDHIELGFSNLLQKVLKMKNSLGIRDYIGIQIKGTQSVQSQLQKYNRISTRAQQQDFNQNISINFGNPFKKRKKINQNQNNQKQIDKSINIKKKQTQEIKYPQAQLQNKKQKIKQLKQEKKTSKILKRKEKLNKQLERKKKIGQKSSKIIKIQKNVYVPCQTVKIVNQKCTQKYLQIQFNTKNLATDLMLKNKQLIFKIQSNKNNKSK